MTQIIHENEKGKILGKSENPSFILTNKIGGFLFLSDEKISRHQGFFFHDGKDLFKTIENVYPEENEKTNRITNRTYCIERNRGLHLDEMFFLPAGSNTLVYTLCERRNIIIELDAKRNHDNREFGRDYAIYEKDNKVIIEFTRRENGNDEYKIFTVINKEKYEKIDKFEKTHYTYDQSRNSPPYDWHIYSAIKIYSDVLVITSHTNLDLALKEHDYMMDEWRKQYETQRDDLKQIDFIEDKEIMFAKYSAQNSLNSLVQTMNSQKGIYAGLPWFYQFWTRDEAISLGALTHMKRYDVIKKIIMRQLINMQKDGKLPNRFPESPLSSADGICWFHKRVGDFIFHLESRNILLSVFTKNELKDLAKILGSSIDNLMKNFAKEGLPVNAKNETWMDTDCNGSDMRDGQRVEIAALYLSMINSYKRLCLITGDKIESKKALDIENIMHAKARKAFWNGKFLNDGSDDKTIRPNVFIAYYAYPNILSKDEWISCFDNALKALFLNWGGISTIQKNSPLFTEQYTGEDNKSYHRGDSWFWLNNLAAICMIDLSKTRYKKYIDKIISASTQEILFLGAVGHHAEVSSAKELSSHGCFMQAWSAAMYVELIEKSY